MSLDMKTTKKPDSTCVRGVGGLSAGGRGAGGRGAGERC
jgi:hypothetical protein